VAYKEIEEYKEPIWTDSTWHIPAGSSPLQFESMIREHGITGTMVTHNQQQNGILEMCRQLPDRLQYLHNIHPLEY